MAFALVQKEAAFNNLGLSKALAFTSSVGGGNAIIVLTVVAIAADSVTSVTDSQGNSYSKVKASNVHAGVEIWMAKGVAAGSTTVTVDWMGSGNPGIGMEILEVSGGITATDGANSASGTTANPSAGSVSTTTDGDFCVAVVAFTAGQASTTAGSGWTLLDAGTGGQGEYQIQATHGSLTGNFVQSSTSFNWDAVIVAFNAGGGGGGGGSVSPVVCVMQ